MKRFILITGLMIAAGLALAQTKKVIDDKAEALTAEQKADSPVLLVMLVQKTHSKALPACFDPPICSMTLRRVDAQVRGSQLFLADLYGQLAGKEHFAWGYRVPAGTRWLWTIQAEDRFWLRALRAWAKSVPGDTQGPWLVSSLPGRNACESVASKTLVGVPVSDAGVPGPLDGGPAPAIRCDDAGGAYYRLQTRQQGWTATGAEDPDGGKAALRGKVPRLEPQVDPQAWEAPDAATHKTCPPIPVGTKCP